jgi:regulator of RNase E activity RraB
MSREGKFATGDTVRNVEPTSACYGLTGTFVCYWSDKPSGDLLTLRNACDVKYVGKRGPYEYPYVAQSADDLERVEENDEGKDAQ